MKKCIMLLFVVGLALTAFAADEWIPLFDGETLEGWTPNESPESWRIEEGKVVADGERSHLFYTGPVNGAVFKNFELKDDPMQVGARGAFMFKANGRYYLTAADYNSRLGRPCNDTWVAYADSIYGPYSERHLMLPHGGGITVFRGPKTTAIDARHTGPYDSKQKKHIESDPLYASFYGGDDRAVFRDRPAFLPLEWTGPDRWDVYFFGHHESFPRKPQCVFFA